MIPLLLSPLLAAPGVRAQEAAQAASATSELDRAYQREYAFLHAEAAALKARLAELERDRDRRLGGAEGELDRAQGRLLALTREADRAEELLRESERSAERSVEATELLRSTLGQAAATLGRADGTQGQDSLSPRDEAGPEELTRGLVQLFEQASKDLQASATMRVVEGPMFDAQGASEPGRIVEIGEVARFGQAGSAGALVPAGEGRLRLAGGERVADGERSARALAAGTIPETVTVHLYESLERRVEEREPKTLADTVEAGGLVGLVIIGLGLLAALLVLARLALLLRAGRGADQLGERVVERIEAGRPEQALELARGSSGAAGRVLARVLQTWSEVEQPSRELLESRASEALLREQPPLERFGAGLRVIAAVAPLLGLLGTVTGMIGTFELITEFGTGDPKMLSTGVSQALVTTQLGLVVAIPVLLVGNGLRARAESVLSSLETGALALINTLAPEAGPQDTRDYSPKEQASA